MLLQLYTMDGSHYGLTTEDSLYYRYNSSMRGRVPEQVELWADYSRILDSALHKLPPQEAALIVRTAPHVVCRARFTPVAGVVQGRGV